MTQRKLSIDVTVATTSKYYSITIVESRSDIAIKAKTKRKLFLSEMITEGFKKNLSETLKDRCDS